MDEIAAVSDGGAAVATDRGVDDCRHRRREFVSRDAPRLEAPTVRADLGEHGGEHARNAARRCRCVDRPHRPSLVGKILERQEHAVEEPGAELTEAVVALERRQVGDAESAVLSDEEDFPRPAERFAMD